MELKRKRPESGRRNPDEACNEQKDANNRSVSGMHSQRKMVYESESREDRAQFRSDQLLLGSTQLMKNGKEDGMFLGAFAFG